MAGEQCISGFVGHWNIMVTKCQHRANFDNLGNCVNVKEFGNIGNIGNVGNIGIIGNIGNICNISNIDDFGNIDERFLEIFSEEFFLKSLSWKMF